MATVSAWAECVILNDGGTYTIMEYKFPAYQATPKVFDISNPRPSGMLTFNYSEGTAPTGGATVTATFLDNSTQEIISKNDSKNQSYNFNGQIVKSLKFVGTGTVKKSISNVKLTQATYVDVPQGFTNNAWSAGTDIVGHSAQKTATIAWSDATFTWELLNNTDNQFSASFSSTGATCTYGTSNITITYLRTKPGNHSATLKITASTGATYTIALSGVTGKYTPQAAKKMDIVMNESYNPSDIFDVYYLANNVKNTISDYTVEALDPTIANYIGGKIVTNYQTGTARFQLTRDADTNFDALNTTISVNVNPAGGCLVLEPCSGSCNVPTGEDFIPVDLTGPADYLSFQARKEASGAVGNIEIKQYVNNEWKFIDDANPGTDWRDYGYTLDESATKVGFFTSLGSLHRYFQNVQVTRKTYLDHQVAGGTLVLPQANMNQTSQKSFNLKWSSCADEILLVSNNALFEVSKTRIDASNGNNIDEVVVQFKGASAPGVYTAAINIYDQTHSIELEVSCEVKAKLATEIVYSGEYRYGESGECLEGLFFVRDENGDVVADAEIVLASSNEAVLEVCGNAGFQTHCGGQVILTATYSGDELREGASWSEEITVANCYQTIDWEQDFRRYVAAEDGTINETTDLTARANPTNFTITYELDEAAKKFAKIENGSLVIFGIGTGHIIASAPAGTFETKEYDAANLMHEIRVRKWGDKCNTDEMVVTDEMAISEVLAWLPTERVFNLDGRPYARMEFYSHVSNESLNNDLTVSFSTDGGSTWTNSKTFNDIPKTYNWNTPYVHDNIPEGANRVKFSTNSTTNTYFNMVKMVQKTYLEPNVTEIRIDDAIVNQQFIREFKVKYSDIPLLQYVISDLHDLGLKLTSTPAIANDCGDWGEYSFTLTGESPYPQENVTDTITFYTSARDVVKIPVTITATLSKPFYFNVQDGDMAVSSNWTYNGSNTHGLLPDKRFPVIVSQAMTINEGELVAYGVTIENGGSVNIQPKGGLTLHAGGWFTRVDENDENNLVIHSNTAGSGFVRVSPFFTTKVPGTMPSAKVNFTTKANMNAGDNRDAAWQYIGAPGSGASLQKEASTVLYLRSEQWGWLPYWNESVVALEPFAGYALTQKEQSDFVFQAQLIHANQTIPLTYTEDGMKGDNLWANSYMAPIDIKKLTDEDFSGNVDQIVYLYNCGSWNEWNKDQSAIQTAEEQPGRYYAIPVGSARVLDATYDQTVIPPMQGVYMVAPQSGGGSLTLNYEKHVWNCTSDKMNQALRIAGKHSSEEDYLNSILRVRLQVNSQNSGADRMYLIQDATCTADYDNGFDAPKQMTEGLLNLYTNEACGKMEISATDNIDGIYLGFAAGEDDVYTMTFTSLIGDNLYLYDVEQDTLVGMYNGEKYEFAAAANSTNDMRFQILVNPDLTDYLPNGGNGGGVTTDTEDVDAQPLWVHDEKVYIAHASINSTLEVYTISGVAIARYTIGYAPCTLDMSALPTGVYMLRLNDQAYKFVCE